MTSAQAAALIARTDETLKSLEEQEIERLNAALEESYLQLEAELLRKYPSYTAEAKPGLLATQRGILLINDLKQALVLISPQQEAEIEARLNRLLQTASKEGVSLGEELLALQQGETFATATATLPIEAVAFAAKDATNRLKKHDQRFQEEATAVIQQGMIQGWGAMQTASQLRQRLGVAKGRAEAIARTEILSAQDSATRQTYKNAGVEYVQRIGTQDRRICSYCAARVGNVYKVDEAPAALHPSDRCFNSPWRREWLEAGVIDEKWISQHAKSVRKQVEARGEQLNYGLAPFERLNGATKPPEAIWKPNQQRLYSGKPSKLERLDRELLELEPLTPEYNAKLKEYVAEQNRVNAEQEQAAKAAAVQSYQSRIDKGRQVFESTGVARALDERLSQYQQADRKQRRVLNQEMNQIMESWRNAMIAASPVSRKDAEGMVSRLKFENINNERVQERLTENMTEFFQLTRGKGSRSLKRIFSDKDSPRAYAYGSSINVGTGFVLPETLLHELGHHIEFEDPKLLEAAQNWIQSRATGNPRSLNSLERTKSYDDDEKAYPDKFISPYVGKVYDSATEVISMGLQYFWNEDDMLKLYRKDPEHFYFTMGALLS